MEDVGRKTQVGGYECSPVRRPGHGEPFALHELWHCCPTTSTWGVDTHPIKGQLLEDRKWVPVSLLNSLDTRSSQ